MVYIVQRDVALSLVDTTLRVCMALAMYSGSPSDGGRGLRIVTSLFERSMVSGYNGVWTVSDSTLMAGFVAVSWILAGSTSNVTVVSCTVRAVMELVVCVTHDGTS